MLTLAKSADPGEPVRLRICATWAYLTTASWHLERIGFTVAQVAHALLKPGLSHCPLKIVQWRLEDIVIVIVNGNSFVRIDQADCPHTLFRVHRQHNTKERRPAQV